MNKLKLNKFAENRLAEKEMSCINGGNKVLIGYVAADGKFIATCGCGCRYENNGGSSTNDNANANHRGGLWTTRN